MDNQDLGKLSYEELQSLKSQLSQSNNSLSAEIAQIEIIIQEATAENLKKEEHLKPLEKIPGLSGIPSDVSPVMRKKKVDIRKIDINSIKNPRTKEIIQKINDVQREKDMLEERLKAEENGVIDRLMSEINKLRGQEIILESQMTDIYPMDSTTDGGVNNTELEEQYQKVVDEKNENNMTLINLRQEIERLITSNGIISQRIASLQMNKTMKKMRPPSGIPPIPGLPSKKMGGPSRMSIPAANFNEFRNLCEIPANDTLPKKRKRRSSHKA